MKKKCLLILTVALVMFSNIASAENHLMKISHSGKQTYFELNAEPGNSHAIEFDVYNDSGNELTNYILVYDSLTAVNGGNEIMSPEEFQCSETAGWFEENVTEITLPDGQSKHIRMALEVPSDTVPGVYTVILGIYSTADAMEADAGDEDGICLNINNYYTSTVAVVINIGDPPGGKVVFGDAAEIKIDVKRGLSYLYVPVRNIGETYEFPIVAVSLSDMKGKLLFEGNNLMGIVYRNTGTYACFDLGASVAEEGRYRAECSMIPNEPGRFDRQFKVFFVNLEQEKAKEALASQINAEIDGNPDWSGGYFILGKKQLMFGLGATVIIISAVCGFILLFKKRKSRMNSIRPGN